MASNASDADRLRSTAEDAIARRDGLEELADNIRAVFWLSDTEKNSIIYVSPAYELVWGRSCQSLYDSPRQWLEAIHPEDRDRILHASTTQQTVGAYDVEYRIIRPDGTMRWIRDRAFPVRDEEGKVYRVAGVADDITLQRDAEQKIRHAQKLEAIGRLASGVAHDFNNLLTVILMNAEEAERQSGESRALEQIVNASEGARALVSQILAFARPRRVQSKVLGVNPRIERLAQTLLPLVDGRIQFVVKLSEDLPPVRGDTTQLDQVIINLVLNAADAMPKGGILTLETHCLREDVVLVVQDTGCGMLASTRERIFEPFFTTKEAHGTGLGLPAVLRTVEEMNGSIEVESEVGAGTTVTLRFPAVSPAPEELRERAPAAETALGTLSPKHVLVVDDSKAIRAGVSDILRRRGHTVVCARDGEEALSFVRENSFELVISDVVMPVMDGMELLNTLKADYPELPVILMSGFNSEVDQASAVKYGAECFLEKPFGQKLLFRVLAQVFSSDGARRATHRAPASEQSEASPLHELGSSLLAVRLALDSVARSGTNRDDLAGAYLALEDAEVLLQRAHRAAKPEGDEAS